MCISTHLLRSHECRTTELSSVRISSNFTNGFRNSTPEYISLNIKFCLSKLYFPDYLLHPVFTVYALATVLALIGERGQSKFNTERCKADIGARQQEETGQPPNHPHPQPKPCPSKVH